MRALAVAVFAAGLLTAGCAASGPAVTVRDAGGALLTRVPAPGGAFAVSYRNSLYGTLAEERYRVQDDGGFRLVQLAADQLAVLEEYYAVPGPVDAAPDGDRRNWVAQPAQHPVFGDLSIAATALGERTLHVPGHPPVPLPPLTGASGVTVVLDVEESR
ncbi:hypothetical protein [Pseudonocardia sp. MH-G8]|uniref:hypothetical protein n=1 Tax=Pseudonocardia sp. MH-G8 TaxID=1854588 RepID=UPI000B9FF3B5|nr:hypothetical protein [Pseudonocardia sp. MH-G8]OZM82199.1 hypothetical protein CFP66_10435 [Pseudonocardia sp. MH-G8]